MLERLLPAGSASCFVLALLGFAATDFLITMTLSAADATAHAGREPVRPGSWMQGHKLLITLVLLGVAGAVFLRGFTEAIGIAVASSSSTWRSTGRGGGRDSSYVVTAP